MNVTISLTGDKETVLSQLHEGSSLSDLPQRECENVIRGTLLDYLEEAAADAAVTVSVSISLTYTPASPEVEA